MALPTAWNKAWVALVGAVVLPAGALIYLASLPDRAKGSRLAILLNVAIVLGAVVLFAIFLARVVEQRMARRVQGWLDSAEGRDWLAALTDAERAEFLDRLDGKTLAETGGGAGAIEADSPVDTSGPSR